MDKGHRMKDVLPSSMSSQSQDYLVFHPVSFILHPKKVFYPVSLILYQYKTI